VSTFVKAAHIAIDGAKTLPGEYYRSPDIFAEEAERIFARRWLCVGRESRVPAPGDYFLQQVGTESVIVLRDERREIRAFYNVCRHRGTRLCEETAGHLGTRIHCPYHAWVYALDGRLLGAPSSDTIDDFDAADYHCIALPSLAGRDFSSSTSRPIRSRSHRRWRR
jgi:Rieske 2Fe-2S family protein